MVQIEYGQAECVAVYSAGAVMLGLAEFEGELQAIASLSVPQAKALALALLEAATKAEAVIAVVG